MATFEIWLIIGSAVLSGAGMAFVAYIVKTSGRDRPNDPEAVQRFIDTAPRWQDGARVNQAVRQTPSSAPQGLDLRTGDEESESTHRP